MGRWIQYDSDEYRLPEGFVRTAYDADTQQYTFRDTTSGGVYRSAPGAVYGILRPVADDYLPDRSHAFAPKGDHHSRRRARPAAPEMTFHDIFPAHAITTAPPKDDSRSNIFQRFKSMRVPLSSSRLNNSWHSRSKSVSERTAHDRDHYDPYQHKRANTTGGSGEKSSFSLTSTFKRLSRSITTARRRARRRAPQEKSTDDDKASGYQRL